VYGPAWKCRCCTPDAALANDGIAHAIMTTAPTTARFTSLLQRLERLPE
jgi:hypothetical protein